VQGHPKSCDQAVLAGDTSGLNEDFPRIITGPGSKALITWSAPQQYWHARTYDGQTFGPVHHLFDNFGSGNARDVRAEVGYGHGLFHAETPGGGGAHHLRRFDQASDTWTAAETQTGATVALGVRPNGSFLRVVGNAAVGSLDTIDPVTGQKTSQPLATFAGWLGPSTPTSIDVDAEDRGALVLESGGALHAFVLRAGQVMAEATVDIGGYAASITLVQHSSGLATIIWQVDAGIRVSRLSYDEVGHSASLSTPETIYQGPGGAMFAVGTPDGELTVIWGNGNTFARRYVAGAWGETITLENGIGGGLDSIAISETGTVAFMLDMHTKSKGVLHTALKGQQTWSSIEIMGPEPYRPSLAFNPAGQPYFIWSSAARDMSGRREIMLTTCR
jgi:hypothetical protein